MTAWHLNKQYMTTLCKHISFCEQIFPVTLSVWRCLSVLESGTVHTELTFIPHFAPMLDDGHPGGYLPQRTAHSTSDCEDWSSSAPPDKTRLFHSCGNDKGNSKPIDTAAHVSSSTAQLWSTTSMPNKFTGVNLHWKLHGAQFTCDRLIAKFAKTCKDLAHDVKFIYRQRLKVPESRQLAKVKAYLLWWFSVLWGHWGSILSICVFFFSV